MAQRGQSTPQAPSIDSALTEPSPRAGIVSFRDETDEAGPSRQGKERQASQTASTWSSENVDSSRSNTTQSFDFVPIQRQDSTGPLTSEPESLPREHGSPRSQSNRSSQLRWISQPVLSSSSLESSGDIVENHASQEKFGVLRQRQEIIPSHRRDDPPRMPTAEDLTKLSSTMVANLIQQRGKEKLENIIIVLHDSEENELSLQEFARQYLRPKDTACLLLRGVSSVSGKENSYHWEDNYAFLRTSRLILDEIICGLLIKECNFPARKIIIFGHGQGAMASLSTFLAWEKIEFGGVICVGGQLHPHAPLLKETKSKTPVLLLGGSLGKTNPRARNKIEQNFSYVDFDLIEGKDDILPRGGQLKSLRNFFAHRLQEEEWTKPAIITFDGGGIKGYGSLLILQALMNKIGAEEKRLDPNTESSFYPSMYKPRRDPEPQQSFSSGGAEADAPDPDAPVIVVPTSTAKLPYSSLFLPCHYFKYAGGTSTGGLISIMISRLRMTVDDCLEEYRNLGGNVFGKPRPFTMKSLLWDKFNSKRLHKAIEDVTLRHCENPHETTKWPSDEDLCGTIVVAYNDKGTSDGPYLFRTFRTYPPRGPGAPTRRTSSMKTLDVRNAGPPQDMDIPRVGRATTAAPGFFKHLETRIGDTTFRFKDGGFGCNNPSLEIYRDVLALLPNGGRDMGPFISIGTGYSEFHLFANKPGRLRDKIAEFKAAKRLPTRTKGAHEAMVAAAYRDEKKRFHYERFEGGRELGKIPMDEWRPNDRTGTAIFTGKHKYSGRDTLKKIEVAVTLYLAEPNVNEELEKCARILVRRRRLQTRDQSKWDRFASASWYICPYSKCKVRRHDTLDDYKRHVLRDHRHQATPKQLDEEVQHARQCWLYRDKANKVASGAGDANVNDDGLDMPRLNPASTFGSI